MSNLRHIFRNFATPDIMKLLPFFLLLAASLSSFAELKVASLHPLMGDLARQVGGERVVVADIGKAGMDVHTFEPTGKDLHEIGSSDLVVASGKGLERYLASLADSLGGIPILEVGDSVPSRSIASGEHSCSSCSSCGGHGEETIDPHWWHDVKNMERATKVMEKQLILMDPDGKDYYRSRSKEARNRLKDLNRWVKGEIASLSKEQRKLVTAHAAFGYFCEAYRMKPVFVLGLSSDHEIPAKALAKEVEKLKSEGVRAVFPEKNLNPKVLAQIAREAGARMGSPLIADGAVSSYDAMIKQNVTAIVQGLSQS